VHCQFVSLQERSAYAIETTAKMAAEKKIDIVTNIDSGYQIYVNPEMLNQVLLNLLENAIKFTSSGGSVTVASGPGAGSLHISDTGLGMPTAEIPKIFERFYRIDRAQSRGSTGLGLSIVKHIADLHGAKINVTSQEGVGSTFTLEFPGPKTGI
jgi:signal transduction histidine kinase